MNSLLQDVRYGIRMLIKNPGFTTVAVLTLGLGIGANTAIFSVINAVLLRPLAVEDPSHIVYLEEQWRDIFPGLSVGNFVEIQSQSKSYSKLCSSNSASFNLAAREVPERVSGEIVTADYFSTFGVQPVLGRTFTPDEDKPGRSEAVVLSEQLWRTRFASNPAIVAQTLRIDGLPYRVVGIMPKTFDPLLSRTDIWVPAAFKPEQLASYDLHYLSVMGRLKPGVSLPQARAELDVIARRLQQEHPLDDKERSLRAILFATALLGDQRSVLWMMLAAVGFVLLIACANIANLQLARSRGRRKEIAMRAALGASPRRIVRQLLAENVVLGMAGGMAGLLLAFWGVSWIVAKGPSDVPRLDQSNVDARTLAFACGVALLSSFMFGLAPTLRSASTRLSDVFKETTGTLTGSRDRIRSVLVVGEIALALVLMAGAGLLIRSALLVSRVNPGFDTTNLFVGRVTLPDASPAVAQQTFERMIVTASALPGVQSAALVSRAPLTGGWSSNGLIAEGKPLDPSSVVNTELQIVSPNYLSTAGVPLKAGRNFNPQDTRDKTLVTIANETLTRAMWPGMNPIGKRFACCESGPQGRMDPVWHEVIGVVGDVRARGLDQQVQPTFYLPIAQMPPSGWDWVGRTMDLVVRTRGGAFRADELRTTIASIAPGVPIYGLSTMDQKIAGTLEASHFDAFLLALFAALALVLSSVGIYGVLSYVVAQRTRAIGIRMALGATQANILCDVLGYGLRLTGMGLAFGLAGALGSARLLSSLLYGVSSTDAMTLVTVSLIFAGVALLASLLPARRATRLDPIVVLRYE
ncbi:MAG TPA: ABC transporter permease [Candidatus Acidoferrum sp.]|jgi:putative ABC transport system permease protein|nr:ABC transporter permease [Candidatus Acidoferrum sp.]